MKTACVLILLLVGSSGAALSAQAEAEPEEGDYEGDYDYYYDLDYSDEEDTSPVADWREVLASNSNVQCDMMRHPHPHPEDEPMPEHEDLLEEDASSGIGSGSGSAGRYRMKVNKGKDYYKNAAAAKIAKTIKANLKAAKFKLNLKKKLKIKLNGKALAANLAKAAAKARKLILKQQKMALAMTIDQFKGNTPEHVCVVIDKPRAKELGLSRQGVHELYTEDDCGFLAREMTQEGGERHRCVEVLGIDVFNAQRLYSKPSYLPFFDFANKMSQRIAEDVDDANKEDVFEVLDEMRFVPVKVPKRENKNPFVEFECRERIADAECSRSQSILHSFSQYCAENGNDKCKCMLCSARKTFANNGIPVEENPFMAMLEEVGAADGTTCAKSFDFPMDFTKAADEDPKAVCNENVMQKCTLSTPSYKEITAAVGKTEEESVDIFDAFHAMLSVDKMPEASLSLSEPKSWTFIVNQFVSKMGKDLKMDKSSYMATVLDFCISHQSGTTPEAEAEAGAAEPEAEGETPPEQEGGRRRLAMMRRRRRGGSRS